VYFLCLFYCRFICLYLTCLNEINGNGDGEVTVQIIVREGKDHNLQCSVHTKILLRPMSHLRFLARFRHTTLSRDTFPHKMMKYFPCFHRAMLCKHGICCRHVFVCPSVCSSHAGVVSKRLNVESRKTTPQ